jgi:hypothetical protein
MGDVPYDFEDYKRYLLINKMQKMLNDKSDILDTVYYRLEQSGFLTTKLAKLYMKFKYLQEIVNCQHSVKPMSYIYKKYKEASIMFHKISIALIELMPKGSKENFNVEADAPPEVLRFV